MSKVKPRCHIDIETYSECCLKTHGVYNYAKHESTEIVSIAFGLDEEPVKLWTAESGLPLPPEFVEMLSNPEYDLAAHNAEFEKVVMCGTAGNKIGIDPKWLSWDRWICTRAKAATYGLPVSLEDCAKALRLAQKKDNKGKRLIKRLSVPQKMKKKAYGRKEEVNREKVSGKFLYHLDDDEFFYYRALPEHAPEDYQAFYDYNIQDVVVEANIDKTLMDIRPLEREVWIADKTINELGVKIDRPVVEKAIEYATRFSNDLTDEFREITGINPSQGQAFIKWVAEQGIELENSQAQHIQEMAEIHKDKMTKPLQRAFEIKSLLSKASVSKYTKILDVADKDDDRVRGCLEYHGAATGRWAAKLVQLQNLTKENGNFKQDAIIRDLMRYDYDTMLMLYGDLYQAFKCCLRGVFIADKGYKLSAPDYSQIEARVLPWLAGDESKLDAFRNGVEIYKLSAARIYNCKPEDIADGSTERSIGKVAELALGYMGGKGAFISMAQICRVHVEEEEAENIKVAWRKSNPIIVKFWYELEKACAKTIVDRKLYHVGKHIRVQRINDFLMIKLPSGRCLFYYKPSLEKALMPWGDYKECIFYWGVKSDPKTPGGKQYCKIQTHGGKLTENITQAASRDILAEAILELQKAGYRIPFHVHDEFILELEDKKDLTLDGIYDIICKNPKWAGGLPLNADGWIGDRYKK